MKNRWKKLPRQARISLEALAVTGTGGLAALLLGGPLHELGLMGVACALVWLAVMIAQECRVVLDCWLLGLRMTRGRKGGKGDRR